MWIDEAEFFSRMESAASKLRRAPSQKNVNGRLADGIYKALDGANGIPAFCHRWVGSPGGSSGLLISGFMRGAVMSADHAHVFQHGREEALTLLDTVRFEEQPQPNGLDLAFRILVAMESQQRSPLETLQAASPAISIVAHYNDNYGFRCFSTFVEGFLGL